jgi:hypothetical protein
MSDFELRICRYVLAVIWLITAALSFGLYPIEDSMLLVEGLGVSSAMSKVFVYAGASLDLVMGFLTLVFPRRSLWLGQAAIIGIYTLLATVLVPEYWLHPFGPLLKNLAVLTVLWLLYRHQGKGGRPV